MARYTLKKHAAADTVKWVIIFLIAIGLIGAVVTLFVMLDRQTTVTEIGGEAYTIATLDENGEQTEGDTSIVTRDTFTTDGLKVELADEASVTYQLSSMTARATSFPPPAIFLPTSTVKYPKTQRMQNAK